jgi:hypothetical protein
VGRTFAKVEAMCLGSRNAGLQEDVVGAMFVRPPPGGRQQAGADTSGAPFGVHSEILDRSPTTEAHRQDIQVDTGHADQLILMRAGFEQCDVFVGEDLRGAFDGAIAVPIRRAAAGRVEEPLQPRYELGLGTSLGPSNVDTHPSIIRSSSPLARRHLCAKTTACRNSPPVVRGRRSNRHGSTRWHRDELLGERAGIADPVAWLATERANGSRIVGVELADEAIRLADLPVADRRTICDRAAFAATQSRQNSLPSMSCITRHDSL